MNIRQNLIGMPVFLIAMAISSCGGREKTVEKSFPADFNVRSDTAKVAYVMQAATPDSVARFICDASLGKVKGADIDTMAIAVAYAYENYTDTCLMNFSREFDDYSSNLPLQDKMKIYLMAGLSDPQRLGYQLGLEYVDHIRSDSMSVGEVKAEIDAFRAACAADTTTFVRFMKGFRTVLKIDHGKDLPNEIYDAFAE